MFSFYIKVLQSSSNADTEIFSKNVYKRRCTSNICFIFQSPFVCFFIRSPQLLDLVGVIKFLPKTTRVLTYTYIVIHWVGQTVR